MTTATRSAMLRKFAARTYRRLPRTCKKLVVVGCALVAYADIKCPRLPLPTTVAHTIIYIQRVFATCRACSNPVIIGRAHGGTCAEHRSMECQTLLNGYLAMQGGADVSRFCSGRSCTHPVPKRGLCECCADNVTPALPGFIRTYLAVRLFDLEDCVFSLDKI